MDIEKIDYATAKELLQRVVAAKGPDFVYKIRNTSFGLCEYSPISTVPEDDPRHSTGCGVGEALKLHGVPVKELGGPIAELHDRGDGSLAEAVACAMTRKALRLFSVFQVNQDTGESWGESFNISVRLAENSSDVDA